MRNNNFDTEDIGIFLEIVRKRTNITCINLEENLFDKKRMKLISQYARKNAALRVKEIVPSLKQKIDDLLIEPHKMDDIKVMSDRLDLLKQRIYVRTGKYKKSLNRICLLYTSDAADE